MRPEELLSCPRSSVGTHFWTLCVRFRVRNGPSRMGIGLQQMMQVDKLLRQFVAWV